MEEQQLNQSQIEEEIRYCTNPKCNKVLDSRRLKYCSELCRARYNALLQYEKLRNNEEFKIKRKEKNKKYYEENKEELRNKMRVYGMQYYFKKRDEKKKIEEQTKKVEEILKETTEVQSKKEETNNEDGGETEFNQTINN